MKKYEICFEDETRKKIQVPLSVDTDSVLHLIAKEENKIISEVFVLN